MRPTVARSARSARFTMLAALLALSAAGATACARRQDASTAPRRDPNRITRQQLESRPFGNLYEVVETLRANWLVTRGATSINTPTQIWVYLDGTRLGGLGSLRTLQPATVESLERIDALNATTRWGIGHGQGVILVTSSQR